MTMFETCSSANKASLFIRPFGIPVVDQNKMCVGRLFVMLCCLYVATIEIAALSGTLNMIHI